MTEFDRPTTEVASAPVGESGAEQPLEEQVSAVERTSLEEMPPPASEGFSLAGVVVRSEEPPPAPAEQAVPAAPPSAPISPSTSTTLSVEDRLRRIEDALAALQPTLPPLPAPTLTQPVPSLPVRQEGPTLTSILASATTQMMLSQEPSRYLEYGSEALRGGRWFPLELLAELRAMLRMHFDPRYRMSLLARVLPPVLLLAMLMSAWMLGSIPLIGWILDRGMLLLLAYLMFKVLTREATRYRMTSPDLPSNLRL